MLRLVSSDFLLEQKLREIRQERYALQSVAKIAMPNERVSNCLRRTINGQVEVWKHLQTEKAFYNGLMVCGSVWLCPVCSAKISEKRRLELKQAFEMHKEEGGYIALLTLTFSHKKEDRLKDTLKRFSLATSRFRSGKRYNDLRDKMGLIGSIRVFEITYGQNGFHPHIHLSLFYTKKVQLKRIQKVMFELWEKACNANGLTTSSQYGLDLIQADKLDEYLSKHGTWTLEQEMSKSHIKKGREGSLTPFDFLREFLSTGESLYLALFSDYGAALKGKRQMQWSQGLKSRFIIVEKSDEELAQEKTDSADLLGLLTFDDWKQILKNDKRAVFLEYIERLGFEKAYDLILNQNPKFLQDKHISKIKENLLTKDSLK